LNKICCSKQNQVQKYCFFRKQPNKMNNYLHILEFFRTFAAESCKENKAQTKLASHGKR